MSTRADVHIWFGLAPSVPTAHAANPTEVTTLQHSSRAGWSRSSRGINQRDCTEISPSAAFCPPLGWDCQGPQSPSNVFLETATAMPHTPSPASSYPCAHRDSLPSLCPSFPPFFPPKPASLSILARRPILQTENIKAYLWLDLIPTLRVC